MAQPSCECAQAMAATLKVYAALAVNNPEKFATLKADLIAKMTADGKMVDGNCFDHQCHRCGAIYRTDMENINHEKLEE